MKRFWFTGFGVTKRVLECFFLFITILDRLRGIEGHELDLDSETFVFHVSW